MSTGAGCLCGAVRVTIDAAPVTARTCWCRLCQYLGGGGGTTNVVFPAEGVTITGAVTWHESVADSGNVMRRGFCPACGTPLFSKTEARPHLIVIRAGALDDPGFAAPEMTLWTSEAPGWAVIDPALPRHDQHVPPTR